MTAINCCGEREKAPRFPGPNGIGPDRRNGPGVPGHVYLVPLRLPHSLALRIVGRLSLPPSTPSGPELECHEAWDGAQMEDPVPGTERVKHRLKPCFPSRNRWENNGPTGPKVSDKCSTRVAGPVVQARPRNDRAARVRVLFSLFSRLRETPCPGISIVIVSARCAISG